MKKLILLIAVVFELILYAGVETVKFPTLDKWTPSGGAQVRSAPKGGLVLQDGKLSLDTRFQTKYGECAVVTARYTGEGRLRMAFTEYDANNKKVAGKLYDFSNPRNELHSRSTTFDVTHKNTVSFGFEVMADKNNSLAVQELMLRRMFGEENALYSPVLNRELWQERIQGVNLAAGLTLKFIPEPDYPLTRDKGTDATDLTDGKLSTHFRDYIWFDSASVGWNQKHKQCKIIADFGSVKKIDRAVMRICGGRIDPHHGYGWFPDLAEVWVSRDGETWYRTSSLKKVKVNERADADWKNLYYLPEIEGDEAPAYVHPFQFDVNAEARYLALIFSKRETLFIADELAIIEGSGARQDFNSAYTTVPNPLLFNTDPIVTPYYPEFYVPRELMLPNWFKLEDHDKLTQARITYSVNFPEQISYTPDTEGWPALMRELVKTEKKDGRVIYNFKCMTDPQSVSRAKTFGLGPFYFRAEADIPAKEKYVEFSTSIDDGQPTVRRMKLNIIDIPRVPGTRHLLLSTPWFPQRITASWPNFIDSAKHIGINGSGYHEILSEKHKPFVAALRANGFKILGVPATNVKIIIEKEITNSMKGQQPSAINAAVTREIDSIKCDNHATVKVHNTVCPAYRGKYYQLLCDTVETQLRSIQPDIHHLDYELWFAPRAFKTCTRCDALRKSENMDWPRYAEWAMADFYKGIIEAARKACPTARVGSYMYCADRKQNVDGKEFPIFGFKYLFPKLLDEAHTPYYGLNPAQVNRRVRANLAAIGDPTKIVAYLTAGIGAYYTDNMGENTKFELVEAYMNGAYGIAYYSVRSFSSPVDFLYVAEGMKAVAPHDEFLIRAPLDFDLKGSNPNLTYTLRKLGGKGLVLVGNYGTMKSAKTFLPLAGLVSAKDCFSGAPVPVGESGLELEIPGDKARFIELKFK